MAAAPRVLHVVRSDHGAHVGGDVVQLEATAAGLRERGVDVVAASVAEAPDAVDVVHVYNLQRPAALLRDLRLARRRWPGAPVALSPVWWAEPLRAMAATRSSALVARATKTSLKRTAWWPYARHALGAVDVVLPNSRTEVDALRRFYRLGPAARAEARWAVVPNGIHVERWPVRRSSGPERAAILAELGVDPGVATVVACVARVEPIKNQLALVEALDDLPEAALVLIGPIGDPAYAASVEAAGAEGSRQGRVALAGRRKPEEVSRLLGAADVHVLASFRETPGLATLEAAATGCGVVVTADGSAPEYLGDAAHVADPTSPASIAAAVRAATADPRQPALRRRVETYTWAAAAEATLAAYERLPGWPSTRS